MSSDFSRYLQIKFFRLLRKIAPKGSALDTVFDSYDDWRIARQRAFELDTENYKPTPTGKKS
jgi:hypothetical protein